MATTKTKKATRAQQIVTTTLELEPAPKPWYQSKTIIANAVAVAVIGLELAVSNKLIADPEYYALAMAVLNILLRLRTNQPVSR